MNQPRKHSSLGVLVLLTSVILAACSARVAPTESLTAAQNVTALESNGQGGLLYAQGDTAEVWAVGPDGVRGNEPVAKVTPSAGQPVKLHGIALGEEGGLYATWSQGNRVLVGELLPEGPRLVWEGKSTDPGKVGGRLEIAPSGRLLTGVDGKLLTLDPNRGPDQIPNDISKNWTQAYAFTFDQDGSLWLSDRRSEEGDTVLARVSQYGASGTVTQLDTDDRPVGMSQYSQQELVTCFSNSGVLQRFLLQDGRARPGRVLAEDCSGDVVPLDNRRLAYVAGDEIRVTAS